LGVLGLSWGANGMVKARLDEELSEFVKATLHKTSTSPDVTGNEKP